MDGETKPRAGAGWTREEDRSLADRLKAGDALPEIAADLGRSEKAVRSRALHLLPPDQAHRTGDDAIGWLRVRLQHGYDWEQATRDALKHAWEPWDLAEHQRLVDELRQGLAWTDIAGAHGRTRSAVRSRASLLVAEGDDVPRSRSRRADMLRDLLAEDPDYDWVAVLHSGGHHAWSGAEDEALRHAWETRRSLPELAAELRLPEPVIARRLVARRLADDVVEVTDRLGCTAGGALDVRRRLALDPANVRLVVLVGNDELGVRHVSLHADAAGAERTRRRSQQADVLTWETWPRAVTLEPVVPGVAPTDADPSPP